MNAPFTFAGNRPVPDATATIQARPPFAPKPTVLARQHPRNRPRRRVRAVTEPEAQWPGQDDASTVYLRGPIAAIHRADDDLVVAVATRALAIEKRSGFRRGAIAKAKGCGKGNRFPNDVATLLGRLRTAGFDVALGGGGHFLVSHPEIPGTATVPQAPSDFRSIPNSVIQIRRVFGIDLREVA